MKVLFLITKSSWGGAQRYVYDLATNLPKEGFEAIVATGGTGPLVNKLEQAEIKVLQIPALQRDISLVKEIVAFWQIGQLIRKEKPDVLHINSSKAGAIGALIGRLTFVPNIVFTGHGWAFNEKRPWWQKIIFKLIHWTTVLLAHKTIAVSYELKRQMNWPFAQKKISVIHNGRHIENLRSRTESREILIKHDSRLKPYANDFWSVTVAELHKTKQHDITIKALAEVVKNHPDVRHLIISTGEEKESLQQLINELRLTRNVFLLGHIDEAAQYLKAFDLFILASSSEALGYVVIEACIAELPIIATDVGGIPEIVSDQKSALLVPSGKKMALSKAYLELYQNPEKRQQLSREAFKEASKFNFTKILQATIDIYNS